MRKVTNTKPPCRINLFYTHLYISDCIGAEILCLLCFMIQELPFEDLLYKIISEF